MQRRFESVHRRFDGSAHCFCVSFDDGDDVLIVEYTHFVALTKCEVLLLVFDVLYDSSLRVLCFTYC